MVIQHSVFQYLRTMTLTITELSMTANLLQCLEWLAKNNI